MDRFLKRSSHQQNNDKHSASTLRFRASYCDLRSSLANLIIYCISQDAEDWKISENMEEHCGPMALNNVMAELAVAEGVLPGSWVQSDRGCNDYLYRKNKAVTPQMCLNGSLSLCCGVLLVCIPVGEVISWDYITHVVPHEVVDK